MFTVRKGQVLGYIFLQGTKSYWLGNWIIYSVVLLTDATKLFIMRTVPLLMNNVYKYLECVHDWFDVGPAWILIMYICYIY